jgi:hypothetical protein
MLFNSAQFLLLFFPLVTLLYYAAPRRVRWILLLAASCYFYMVLVPAYILVLAAVMFRRPAFNFGFDKDTPNQMYYKLRYLERAGIVFDTLIVGVDYFEFSSLEGTRHDAYGRFSGIAVLE